MSADAPLFSVIIPSRNNRARLEQTLDSIAHAEANQDKVEVIVVDDGSTDGTYEAFNGRRYPFRLQVHRGDFANQSAGTNLAIRRATGRLVVSSASDILFHRKLLAEHLAWHDRFEHEEVVVLGYLPYAEQLQVTPFMFYLVNGGFQFAFFLIRDQFDVPPNFLYAPNFSVKREVLERVGGFDEQFRFGCQDTDLGIRLSEAGVRMVYNADAIGYHNHPVEMSGYLRRQEMAGEALVHLELKHPDHEGGLTVWDGAIRQYLMYSDVDHDRDLAAIERLETEVARLDPAYRELWVRAFCQGTPAHTFDDSERRTLRLVDALFNAYNRVLGFHWAKGYLARSVHVHGREQAGRRLRARMAKQQASVQVWNAVDERLGELGLEPRSSAPRRHRTAMVVFDLGDYPAATRFLEQFQNPPARRCGCQVVLVVNPEVFSPEQTETLGRVADVVVASCVDDGIAEAIARCRAEVVAISSARVEPVHPHALPLAERLLDRLPDVAVLGGSIDEPSGSTCRYGLRPDGAVLSATHGSGNMASGSSLTPVHATIPEYCFLRRSTAMRFLEDEPARDDTLPWNLRIGAAAARHGRLVVHVPELEVRYVERGLGAAE